MILSRHWKHQRRRSSRMIKSWRVLTKRRMWTLSSLTSKSHGSSQKSKSLWRTRNIKKSTGTLGCRRYKSTIMRMKTFSKTPKMALIKAPSIHKNNPFSRASIRDRSYKKTTTQFKSKQKIQRKVRMSIKNSKRASIDKVLLYFFMQKTKIQALTGANPEISSKSRRMSHSIQKTISLWELKNVFSLELLKTNSLRMNCHRPKISLLWWRMTKTPLLWGRNFSINSIRRYLTF